MKRMGNLAACVMLAGFWPPVVAVTRVTAGTLNVSATGSATQDAPASALGVVRR